MTETECVYGAVWPEYLGVLVIQSYVRLPRRSAGDAVTVSSSLSTSHRNSIEMRPDSWTLRVIYRMNSERIGNACMNIACTRSHRRFFGFLYLSVLFKDVFWTASR